MFGEIHGGECMARLNEFIGTISKQQLATKSQYKVKIFGPGNKSADENLNLLCESISFPGQNVRSVPDTLRFGPAREHGQGMTYGPFNATFVCSKDLREKRYFEWWQRQIINQNYKRDPKSVDPDEMKYVDRENIKPVKITDYPEVFVDLPKENSQTTINKDPRPVEQIVSELANDRLIREQRDWDQRYGKFGITGLKRPE